MTSISHDFLNNALRIHDTGTLLNRESTGICATNAADWSVKMSRLMGGVSDGVDVLSVNNGRLSLDILPTRGMGIWKGDVNGVPVRWNSPVEQPVNPSFVDAMRRGGIGWLDGFNELICRCGLGWHGAPGRDIVRNSDGKIISDEFLTLHGRIANLPAHRLNVTVSPDDRLISVRGIVDEGCLFGGRLRMTSTLSTEFGSSAFCISDVVQNLSSQPAEVEMLYHCNIGEPFLGEGSVYHGVASEVAPRDARAAEGISMWNLFERPVAGYAEQVYFSSAVSDESGLGIGLLCDATGNHAFCVRFDTSTLPWMALWKNTQDTADGYVTGLEPASSFPNPRMFEREQGRVIRLAPGGEVRFQLTFEVATEATRVRQLVDEVTTRQVAVSRIVHERPRPGWSP